MKVSNINSTTKYNIIIENNIYNLYDNIISRFIYELSNIIDIDTSRSSDDIQGLLFENLFGVKYNKHQDKNSVRYNGDTMNSWKSHVKYIIYFDKEKNNLSYYRERNRLLAVNNAYSKFKEELDNYDREIDGKTYYEVLNEFAFNITTIGNYLPSLSKRGSFNQYRGKNLYDMFDLSLMYLKNLDMEKFRSYTGFDSFQKYCETYKLFNSFVVKNKDNDILIKNLYTGEYQQISNYSEIKKYFDNQIKENDIHSLFSRISNINKAISERNEELSK